MGVLSAMYPHTVWALCAVAYGCFESYHLSRYLQELEDFGRQMAAVPQAVAQNEQIA